MQEATTEAVSVENDNVGTDLLLGGRGAISTLEQVYHVIPNEYLFHSFSSSKTCKLINTRGLAPHYR